MVVASKGCITFIIFLKLSSTFGFVLNCTKEIEQAIKNKNEIQVTWNLGPALHRCFRNNPYDITQLPRIGQHILVISYTFDFVNLINLDNDGTMEIVADLEFEWTDEFRKWNASEFFNLERITIPSQELWAPKILLTNCESNKCIFGISNDTYALIFSSGSTVVFLQNQRITSTCDMDLHNFPYDSQTCSLTFQVQSHLKNKIAFESYNGTFMKDIIDNDEWTFLEIYDGPTNVTYWRYYRDERGHYNLKTREEKAIYMEGFVVDIFIKRRPLYYETNLIVPVFLVSLIGIFANFLHATLSDKLNMQVTVFLGFLFLQTITASIIPQSDTEPNITIYILNAMLISGFNVIYSTILLMGKSKKGKQLPKCIELIFVQFLGFIVSPKKLFKFLKSHRRSRKLRKSESDEQRNKGVMNNVTRERDSEIFQGDHGRMVQLQSFEGLNMSRLNMSQQSRGLSNKQTNENGSVKSQQVSDSKENTNKIGRSKHKIWEEFLGNMNLLFALLSVTLSALDLWFYLIPLILRKYGIEEK